MIVSLNILVKSVELLSSDQNMRIVFNALEGNYALCLLANLVQLSYIEREESLNDKFIPNFVVSKFNRLWPKQ